LERITTTVVSNIASSIPTAIELHRHTPERIGTITVIVGARIGVQ
jgi:hypothetical protein